MDKFNRNYSLYIQQSDGNNLHIELPFTMEFDIQRKLFGSANAATFRVYNLNKVHRNLIRYNFYNTGQFRALKLYAGYGNNLSLIFSGNVHECFSVREGNNFITTIEGYDAGFAWTESPFNQTLTDKNQTQSIKKIISNLSTVDPNVSLGVVSQSFSVPYTRPQALSGSSAEVIQQMLNDTGGLFFIDNGVANVIADNEYITGPVATVNSDSGLLNTPLYEQSTLAFDVIFEPGLKLAQLVTLESSTDNNFNGTYKITSLSHRGTISSAVSGDAITSIRCITKLGGLQPAVAA